MTGAWHHGDRQRAREGAVRSQPGLRAGLGRAEPPATCRDAGCVRTRMHWRAPGRAQPRGHLRPDQSHVVLMRPDSSRKGLGTGEPSDVLVQPAWLPWDRHWRQSRSLLLTATYSPEDMVELGPVVGPMAPVAWGTVTICRGEAWYRAGAPRGRGVMVGVGLGDNAGLWDTAGAVVIAVAVPGGAGGPGQVGTCPQGVRKVHYAGLWSL